ncbi:M24 family metallopeptidase [Undibacterium sp. SXout7W]|uniref:M24 family metallopeptidase n=1 Tax=Undibacterium sp. SXout7W TaxID=3413049 RepID=UPI003BF24FFA
MPTASQINEHRKIQAVAKSVLDHLSEIITAQDTEKSIADKAYEMMRINGYPETWYHNCPALVLLGSRSCVSVSGSNYAPSDETVGMSNLITVDLSPMHQHYWGDCARSFAVEKGRVTSHPQSLEFQNGLHFLHHMHTTMQRIVKPSTTFGQLFDWANMRIRQNGFVNLDYRNNVGHSIVTNRDDREYIQAYNQLKLEDVAFFSFEPFVRLKGGHWGFKREGIFYFDQQGILEEL